MFPKEFDDLVEMLREIPGISQKQATKIVNFFLKKNKNDLLKYKDKFFNNLLKIDKCSICGFYATNNECLICDNKERNNKLLIVENLEQIQKYENWKIFDGKYYSIPILFNKKLELIVENLNIDFLIKYINHFDEIIIALSPTVEGVFTTNYLCEQIKKNYPKKHISSLSIGIPMGSSIDFMDQLTLSYAIKNRKDIE